MSVYQLKAHYATFYVSVVTFLRSCTVCEIWRIITPSFAVDRECLSLTHSLEGGGEAVNSGSQRLAQETINILYCIV